MRLSKFLATATLGLLLTQFHSTLWAQDVPSDLDPNASTPIEGVPTDQTDAKYSGPPKISYYLSDENFIIIKVDGLKLEEVKGFTFDGTDISDAMKQFETDGTIEIVSRDDGFNLTVKIPNDQLPGQHKFGLLYGNNELSATLDSEKLTAEASASDDRAFGYLRVYGNVQEYLYGCSWNCWRNSSYAAVHFWVWDGYWAYVGAATADAYGNFDVNINGVCGDVYIEAVNNGKWGKTSSSVWSCGWNRTYVSVYPYIR